MKAFVGFVNLLDIGDTVSKSDASHFLKIWLKRKTRELKSTGNVLNVPQETLYTCPQLLLSMSSSEFTWKSAGSISKLPWTCLRFYGLSSKILFFYLKRIVAIKFKCFNLPLRSSLSCDKFSELVTKAGCSLEVFFAIFPVGSQGFLIQAKTFPISSKILWTWPSRPIGLWGIFSEIVPKDV